MSATPVIAFVPYPRRQQTLSGGNVALPMLCDQPGPSLQEIKTDMRNHAVSSIKHMHLSLRPPPLLRTRNLCLAFVSRILCSELPLLPETMLSGKLGSRPLEYTLVEHSTYLE